MSAPRLVAEFLEGSAQRGPERVALSLPKSSHTWGEIDARANRLARALRARGVKRGDRVVILGDNQVDVAVAIFAASKADGVFCVINGQMKAEKIAYILRDAEAAALIADAVSQSQWIDACAQLRDAGQLQALRTVLVCGTSEELITRAVTRARDERLPAPDAVRDAEALESPEAPPRRALDVDLASIIYTSGSTGEPKGAMLSHRNMEFASWSVTSLLHNTADDVVLGVVPLSFNYGLYQWLMSARLGMRLVMERGFTFPAQVIQRVAAERVTGFPGVPTMFALLGELKDLPGLDLSAVRYVTSTAAALLPKHIDAVARWFPRAEVFSMYGLTECKRVSWLPPADLTRKPGSVGIPIPGTEFWVVAPDGQRLGPGEAGELVVRGSHIMQGYWKKPEATARYLRPGNHPQEVLFYTGDACQIDDEGYLYFIARMDEVIKTRGEKVAPREVEAALERIEGVLECAVIGVDDAVLGAAVKAFVVLSEEFRGRYTAKDITLRLGQTLEPYMVPKHVEFMDALPKTSMGKILKKGLR